MGPDRNEIKDGTFYILDENGEAHMAFNFPIGYVEINKSDNAEPEAELRNLYLGGTVSFSGTITKKSARKLQRFFEKKERYLRKAIKKNTKICKRYVRRSKFRRMIRKIFKRGE